MANDAQQNISTRDEARALNTIIQPEVMTLLEHNCCCIECVRRAAYKLLVIVEADFC